MKSLMAFGDGRVDLIEISKPVKAAEEILIRPLSVGICGTDLEIISSDIDPAFISYPVVLGHEWSGEVLEGSILRPDIRAGDLVVVQGIIPCEKCRECLNGDTNRCEIYDEFGFTRNGACSPFVVAPAPLVYKIEGSIKSEVAALAEPIAVVLTGLLKTNLAKNASILVIGDGTIGLLAVALAKIFEPSQLHLTGLRLEQSQLALKLGAERFLNAKEENPNKYDLVVEASGSISGVETGMNSLNRGATLLVLGFSGGGKSIPLNIDHLVNGDNSIIGSFGSTTCAWERAVSTINSDYALLEPIITHTFSIEEWQDAIDTLKSAKGSRGKVILDLK